MLDSSKRYAHYVYACARVIYRGQSIISIDIQFTVIVLGEALAAKNHNQDIQNYTRKILFMCKKP